MDFGASSSMAAVRAADGEAGGRRDSRYIVPDVERLSPGEAQRHSKIVRHLRLALPAAAAGLLATYAISAKPPQVDIEFAREFAQIDAESDDMRLERPRYVGEDLSGKAFEVSAAAAQRNMNSPSRIALENPEAMRGLNAEGEKNDVRVRARTGLLDTDANKIDLSDDVQMTQSIGGSDFVIRTDAAAIDLDGNTVTTNAGIQGEGEGGTVAADSATAYQGEGRLVLEGNVRLRLNPKSEKSDDESGLR